MYTIPLAGFNPAYTLDYETTLLSPIPNYFSDLLAKQAELAKTGESQLTQQELEELSGKCDMSQMSTQEFKDLINYLADKGVIERTETFDYDAGEPIYIKKGQAWLEPAKPMSGQSIGTPGVARFLHPFLEEMHKKLLAEQAAAELLQSTDRIV